MYASDSYDKYTTDIESAEKELREAEQTSSPSFQKIGYLAWAYLAHGKYDQAEQLYKRSCSIWYFMAENPAHPEVIAAGLLTIAKFYIDTDREYEAKEIESRIIALHGSLPTNFKSSYRNGHIAEFRKKLADQYVTQGKYNQAEQLYMLALEILDTRNNP